MKLLLVGSSRELVKRVHTRFGSQGVDVIRYSHPIKAMDNLEEVQPSVVLFSSSDFPRHWKPFLTFLRGELYRDRCVFILLIPPEFSEDDALKAQHLGANGLISEALADESELARLHDIIARYQDLRDTRSATRYRPTPQDRVAFLATHPRTRQLIFGTVRDLSVSGLAFIPDIPAGTAGLDPGSTIPTAALRIGDDIILTSVTVLRHDDALILLFDHLSARESALLEEYFEQRAGRPQAGV